MEFAELEFGLKAIASCGNMLNTQEVTRLQAGLNKLKSGMKLDAVYMWGKIFGIEGDYYIAYSLDVGEFEFPAKTFYYAMEDFDFKELELITEKQAAEIFAMRLKSFSGDASRPLREVTDDAENYQGPREVERLTMVVQEIDYETSVVPKGAYSINEEHRVVPARDFKGLGLTEATDIAGYVHFRPPTSIASLRALARTDCHFFPEFLDPVAGDLPTGCWTVRQEPCVTIVTVRSLYWQGYVAYHVPNTNKFGGLYFGYGQKNRDLPFILS